MKVFAKIIFFLFLFCVIIFGIVFFVQQQIPSRYLIHFPQGNDLVVGVARTQKDQEQGLSNRVSLPQNEGLLFIHDTLDYQSYWMKDMLFPIDLIWISGNQVVGVQENLLPQKPPLTIYTSAVPVDKVLEVNAGFVEKNGVKIGDFLDISSVNE